MSIELVHLLELHLRLCLLLVRRAVFARFLLLGRLGAAQILDAGNLEHVVQLVVVFDGACVRKSLDGACSEVAWVARRH